MSSERRAHRSYLYVAGTDSHRFEKARLSGADAIILDLEDAVALNAKDTARLRVSEYVQENGKGDTAVHVRINAVSDGMLAADLEAAVWPGVDTVRIPKAEDAQDVRSIDEALTRLEERRGVRVGSTGLTLLVESARGALTLADLIAASPRVSSVALGSTDFLADIGARGSDDLATLHVRSQMVLIARSMGLLAPIDSVTTALSDPTAVAREAMFARGLGFFGKSLIHPKQIVSAHDVFSPTAEELEHARKIVTSADAALAAGDGASTYQGEFVDPAIVARYRALLARGGTTHDHPSH